MTVGVGTRGNELLLAHCEALEPLEEERPGSYERLAGAIGDRLARLLVFALSDDSGRRSHGHDGR
jgi:hypothetical protein